MDPSWDSSLLGSSAKNGLCDIRLTAGPTGFDFLFEVNPTAKYIAFFQVFWKVISRCCLTKMFLGRHLKFSNL